MRDAQPDETAKDAVVAGYEMRVRTIKNRKSKI